MKHLKLVGPLLAVLLLAAPTLAVTLRAQDGARQTNCANNLSQLWKWQFIYQIQFGGRNGFMDIKTGDAFWLKLSEPGIDLISKDLSNLYQCPVENVNDRGCDYRGPSKNVNKYWNGNAVGADRDGNHGIGKGGNVLRKNGEVRHVSKDDALWKLAEIQTSGGNKVHPPQILPVEKHTGQQLRALVQISQIRAAILLYRRLNGTFPRSLNDLVERAADAKIWPEGGYYPGGHIPKDPWGKNYQYDPSNKKAQIWTWGADGKMGGRGENTDLSFMGYQANPGSGPSLRKKDDPRETGTRNRPELAEYQTLLKRLILIRKNVDTLEVQFRLKTPWTQEMATSARKELNSALDLLKSSDALAAKLKNWFGQYVTDFGELQKANEVGDKNRVDELNKKLERDKYVDIDFKTLGKGHVVAAVNRVNVLKRRAARLNHLLPSLDEISKGQLPESGIRRPYKKKVKKPTALFNTDTVTPFFFMIEGGWRRDKVVTEDLALFGEPTMKLRDTVLLKKALSAHFVVLKRIQFTNQVESAAIEQKLDVVKVTKEEGTIKIGKSNIDCRVLRSPTENRWVPTSGPMANQLPLKMEKEDVQFTAVEIETEKLVVRKVSLNCIRVKYEGTFNNNKVTQTVWYSLRVPLWIVKKATEVKNSRRVTETLMDYGPPPRKPFPVEKE